MHVQDHQYSRLIHSQLHWYRSQNGRQCNWECRQTHWALHDVAHTTAPDNTQQALQPAHDFLLAHYTYDQHVTYLNLSQSSGYGDKITKLIKLASCNNPYHVVNTLV